VANLLCVIEGLQILAKYVDANSNDVAAEHDVIYGPYAADLNITDEDKEKLEELGWFIDSEVDSWAVFV
jgi:hypothetical protein